MTFRNSAPLSLLVLSLTTAACGVDRATAPNARSEPSAALTFDAPSISVWPGSDVVITVAWSDTYKNETGFEVHRSRTGATGAFELVTTTDANVESYADGGRIPLTEYCYKVRMVRVHGKNIRQSSFSEVACATTLGPPPAPTNVASVPKSSLITTSWNASPTASSYRLQRSSNDGESWETIASFLASWVRSYDDSGRPLEQRFCYRVVAVNHYGENTSEADCTAIPTAPTGLTATTAMSGGVTVAWEDTRVEDGYEIQRSGPDLAFVTITTVLPNETTYHDPITTDGYYWYRVRATKDGGFSGFSTKDDVLVTTSPPAAPTNTFAYVSTSTTASVHWTDASTNETHFRIERSSDGATWTTVGTVSWNTTSFEDAELTPEQQVCYRVVAVNDVDESSPSNVNCTLPMPGGFSGAPADLGQIQLTWEHDSAVKDGYVLSREVCYPYFGGCYYYYYEIATLGPGATSHLDTGLEPGGGYSYQLQAFKDESGRREYSSATFTWASAGANP